MERFLDFARNDKRNDRTRLLYIACGFFVCKTGVWRIINIMDIIETVESGLKRSGGDIFCIGESVCGNDILCAHKGGYGGRQLIITAAIHARECYTALVVLRQAAEFSGGTCDGVYFVPLVDPDGAAFFERGETFGREFLCENISRRYEWKANADGVDLNTNFDARYGTGKFNTRVRGPSDYIGEFPLCAPESRALALFTQKVKPAATVSYHCMGGELYWEFFQSGARRRRDEAIAAAVARHIGVKKVDGDLNSAGGYKDYCISALKIPALTVELISSGTHPFAPTDFSEATEANADLPRLLFELLPN